MSDKKRPKEAKGDQKKQRIFKKFINNHPVRAKNQSLMPVSWLDANCLCQLRR